jgi:2-methylcitrate dehydratase
MNLQNADEALEIIATYVSQKNNFSQKAYDTARLCLADSIGCAFLALNHKACTKLLGPVVPNTIVPKGSRVPGTDFVLDPVCAAFNIGTLIRWLDYNDTWLAAEWGHPSDNIGGLLAVMDFISQNGNLLLTIHDLLTAIIKVYEIQGILALENSFNRIGLDHVILVKVATAAVTTHLLGGTYNQIVDAVSQAWIDLGPLRTYRHAPNTGSRKSWAAGDATSRGVQLAMMTMKGEMGYKKALSAGKWGFYDVLLKGEKLKFARELGSYVVENILFKVAFPVEFHAQTAVEASFQLHPKIFQRLDEIDRIEIDTHESAMRIINKTGKLLNPADRDHCIQYAVAIGLIYGKLTDEHFEDHMAIDPMIDQLRDKMVLKEIPQYTEDYLNPEIRSISNAVTIYFKDGSRTERVKVEFPIGHSRRRKEAIPLLWEKFRSNLATRLDNTRVDQILMMFQNPDELEKMAVHHFMDKLIS